MNSPFDSLENNLRALRTKSPHIHSLRFPNYRSLQPNSELAFGFPITILLGCNGSNKSSILYALYGSPWRQSLRDFWFETKLDKIERRTNGLTQSVVHRYINDEEELVECLKLRYFRAEDPDYWEPAQHRLKYGFSDPELRISPIQLHVTHLDFRGELPAFDKYFYFPNQKHLQRRHRERMKVKRVQRNRKYDKQDYLRSRSKLLKRKFEKSAIELSPQELDFLKYILEREYTRGRLLEHSLFYGHEGWSILFETEHLSGYSDAFAGSGESAATLLVHRILQAPRNSLILLDEPETSLHPRAQQRMLEFLAHYAVRKSLQIVIATHSIHFTENLPQEAIRVLQLDDTGYISIREDLSAKEALHEIGTFPAGKTILVEDERAQFIVTETLKLISSQAFQEFNVVVQQGGTAKIYRDIKAFSNSGMEELIILFDGDHAPEVEIPKEGALPRGKEELKNLIKELTKGNNSVGPDPQKILGLEDSEEMIRYIQFFRKYVRFLPRDTPEHLVWDQQKAEELLGSSLPNSLLQEEDYKVRLKLVSDQIPGLQPNAVFQILLSKLLTGTSTRKDELLNCIHEIRSLA